MLVAASFTSCKEKEERKRTTAPHKKTKQQKKKIKQKNSKSVFLLRDVIQKHTCIRAKDN